MLDKKNLGQAVILNDLAKVEQSMNDVKKQIAEFVKSDKAYKSLNDGEQREICNQMLENFLNSSMSESTGQVMIHAASYNRNKQTLSILLHNGANPNVQDSEGNTALHYLFDKHDEMLEYAMKQLGITSESRNFRNIKASLRTMSPEIKLLQQYGADFNIQNNEGKTPLDVLSEKIIKATNLKPELVLEPELQATSYEAVSQKKSFAEEVIRSRAQNKENGKCCSLM